MTPGHVVVLIGSYGWPEYYDRLHVHGEDEVIAARALVTQLAPPAMLAACVAAVLVADGVLPPQLTPDDAGALVEGAALILDALNIAPDSRAGTAGDWPVMAEIIQAAPHQHGAW